MAKNQKNKRDIGKIAGKVLAFILAGMMLVSVAATLIFCLVRG